MKATEIRRDVLDYILSEVQNSVMRLGINAQLRIRTKKDYRGEPFIAIESDKFQTMPVLFKEVTIEGGISVTGEPNGMIEVFVRLDYCWRSFTGGTNGTELGAMYFWVEKDLPAEIEDDSYHFYIQKKRGLEL